MRHTTSGLPEVRIVPLRRVDLVRLFKMAEITKIERLDGKNYQSWEYNIKLVLMERGLWRFVEGKETATGASAAPKDRFLIGTGTS